MATNNSTNAGSVRDTAPGLDIFKTPENPTFYSANLYHNLDKSKQEIRLIELSTQTGGNGILECKLLPAVLLADTRKQYLALSYCAGDPADTKEIMVNGVKCNVFANLHHALVLARRYWIQSPEQGQLRLWIDQLCINQHDLSERSHQVGFMRDIYQSAERTLACLSTSATSGDGLKWLNDLCDAVTFQDDRGPSQYDREGELGTEDGDESKETTHESAGMFQTKIVRLQSYLRKWYLVRDYFWNNMPSVRFVKGWIEFYEVIGSQWWNRAWICQEFLVSSHVTFMFRNHFVSWGQCWKVMQAFCEMHKHDLVDRKRFLESTKQSRGCLGDVHLCRILSTVNRKDLVRQIEHVRTALELKIRWRGGMDIKALLSHSRSCRSSDDRDRVYAMLGLASPGYKIFPDYSSDLSASEVMILTTRAIIERDDSLDILTLATRLVQHRNFDVPSWVVDWSSTEASKIDFGNMHLIGQTWIPHESPRCVFDTITTTTGQTRAYILRVHGTFITKIETVATAWPCAQFMGSRGWYGRALISVLEGDELWFLYGSRVPMVLRPYLNGYRVVSSALLLRIPPMGTEESRADRSRIMLY